MDPTWGRSSASSPPEPLPRSNSTVSGVSWRPGERGSPGSYARSSSRRTSRVPGPGTVCGMRRRLSLITSLLAVLLALVVAGCGSSSSSDPLKTSLSYFPKNSLFVMSIQTDPNSSAIQSLQSLLHRFPAVTFGEAALTARLQQLGINYDTDIRPLFGNPAVIGVASPSAAGARSRFLVVWETKDQDTLKNLIKKLRL